MSLKMRNLEECFRMAKAVNATWVAVAVKSKDCESSELIINTNVNFDTKLEYYKKAYTDDLVLKSYDGIKIVGFTYADTLKEIEDDLFEGCE